MMRQTLLKFSILFFCSFFIQTQAQTLKVKKDLNLSGIAYYSADTINKNYTFYTFSQAQKENITINSVRYDADFNPIGEHSEMLDLKQAHQKYPWCYFNGDNYSDIEIGINASGSKVLIEAKTLILKFNYSEGKYESKYGKTETVKPVNRNNESYTYYSNNHVIANNCFYGLLFNSKTGYDIIKIRKDLTYNITPLYCDFEGTDKSKLITDKSRQRVYMLGLRSMDLVPPEFKSRSKEGCVLYVVDSDINVIKEVFIEPLKKEEYEHLVLVTQDDNLYFETPYHTYLFDKDLNLIEKKNTPSEKEKAERVIYSFSDKSVCTGVFGKQRILTLNDRNNKVLSKSPLPDTTVALVYPVNFQQKHFLLVGTLWNHSYSNELRYSLFLLSDSSIELTNTISNKDLIIPEKDRAGFSMFGSDKYNIISVKISKYDVYKSNNACLLTYFIINNTTDVLCNFARMLMIGKDGSLKCFEVNALKPEGEIVQDVFFTDNYVYWGVVGNNSSNLGNEVQSPKIACIDPASKAIIKYHFLDECVLHPTFPFIKSFNKNDLVLLSSEGVIYKVSLQ
jgi:hypothetical protein